MPMALHIIILKQKYKGEGTEEAAFKYASFQGDPIGSK